jgi:hypothetical protein
MGYWHSGQSTSRSECKNCVASDPVITPMMPPTSDMATVAKVLLSVALAKTGSVAAARAALEDSDVPAEIRTAAIALFGELATASAEPAEGRV